eukprot:m.21800 g.21800  ORF g.21800 m.21800 type:complete len:237 (-) comp7228_c0_seq1:214-924(-)
MATVLRLGFRRVALFYKETSRRYPHTVAGTTACAIMSGADIAAQYSVAATTAQHLSTKLGTEKKGSANWSFWDVYDSRRTIALATFGFLYYGGPVKKLYLALDCSLSRLADRCSKRAVAAKTFIDCYIHTPFLLVPTFYFVTGVIQGKSTTEISHQLQNEWYVAAFGSALFWTPAQVINFAFVPQHSKVLFVAVLSFIHKTWLSWFTNRDKIGAAVSVARGVQAAAKAKQGVPAPL